MNPGPGCELIRPYGERMENEARAHAEAETHLGAGPGARVGGDVLEQRGGVAIDLIGGGTHGKSHQPLALGPLGSRKSSGRSKVTSP